ncbi:flagellar motor switch protein FliN [Chitinimonas sp. BJYL2]|uniref:flagellar motor switch protein FliN n=1 Tax=Chitinimonas sp. BJYL2 TaxID=2976696 RepID=UPI0022B47A2A
MSNETEEQGLDDWAAALAEQEAADAAAAAATVSSLAPPSAAVTSAAAIFQSFDKDTEKPSGPSGIEMIMDIPVTMTVELGRTKIAIRSLLQLAQGSVVELEGLAGEPMDVLVNGTLIAQGEVVVVNDKFGIRLTDIITPAERIRRLHK